MTVNLRPELRAAVCLKDVLWEVRLRPAACPIMRFLKPVFWCDQRACFSPADPSALDLRALKKECCIVRGPRILSFLWHGEEVFMHVWVHA